MGSPEKWALQSKVARSGSNGISHIAWTCGSDIWLPKNDGFQQPLRAQLIDNEGGRIGQGTAVNVPSPHPGSTFFNEVFSDVLFLRRVEIASDLCTGSSQELRVNVSWHLSLAFEGFD